MTPFQFWFVGIGLGLDLTLAVLPVVFWLRYGRDPHFTDDDSVLMPAPPPDFTPALASVVLSGKATRGTVLAGLMDLASHNLISFYTEPFPVGHRAGIKLTTHRPRRLHLPAPETSLYEAIALKVRDLGRIDSLFLVVLNEAFSDFIGTLDNVAVQRGWLRTRPSRVIRGWRILAGVAAGAGVLTLGCLAPLAGSSSTEPMALEVALVGIGALVAAGVTFLFSTSMPARTAEGAKLAGWLNAYRRTLIATIAQATSIEQVVEMRPLPWVGTPSEEIAWAAAFGLDRQIDSLLSQSLEVSQTGGWPTGIRDWFSII